MGDEFYLAAAKHKAEKDHLFFTRYFFKQRHGTKFIVNWHHQYMCDEVQKVIDGETKNLVINVSPGSSKTEIVVINLIARGLAINPFARFLHLSYSDDLALLNSQIAREIIRSDEYQELWPRAIATDTKAKKRWNILVDGKLAGGVYATSLSGQVTGFRAGHMADGFQGAIIIDDPLKPEDAFSKSKLESANRKLLTTVKSRRARPDTPIILIMQRISDGDPVQFIKDGGLQGDWRFIKIPALVDDGYMGTVPDQYRPFIDSANRDSLGRYSYWEFKERALDLVAMSEGRGVDQSGAQISRHVFSSQYQQEPTSLGGNIIKGKYFVRYKVLPQIKYRKIFADTAQKTKEANDYSVFECWGLGDDNRLYLLDMIRGKWEAPELQSRAIAFWNKCKDFDVEIFGQLRQMIVEDKSSGTGLVQTVKLLNNIPIKGLERNKDKYTRVLDALPYIEAGRICLPEDAAFTNDFIAECEAFTSNDSHMFDDQIDPMLDAIIDMISAGNKMSVWERLGSKDAS
jgi:predicted phage terminase large subunit-like protein